MLRSRFRYDRKHIAVAKVFFDMYDGYMYPVDPAETDPLVRFHFIVSQIHERCRMMRITEGLSLPNGMTVMPSYVPYTEDDRIVMIEVIFNLEVHGSYIGRIKDIICAHDSFAIDLGYIIIGSGIPVKAVTKGERMRPLMAEILKLIDDIRRETWPTWKGKRILRTGHKTPLLDWSDDPLYTIGGIRRTVYQWSDIMGVDALVTQRELDNGAGIEEALKEAEMAARHSHRVKNIPITHTGDAKTYFYEGRWGTLEEWAATIDIPSFTLAKRMERGMSFAEAYEYKGKTLIEIGGEYRTLTAWCREYNLDRRKVERIIADGVEPSDAIISGRMRIAEAEKKA